MLADLHEERWRAEGKKGVFASPVFLGFHREAMKRMWTQGALWLAWLEVEGEPVVAIYSLRWGNKVRFYQSGRRMNAPSKARPGLVIHIAAMQEAIGRGESEYDFLGGTARYKMQLSSNVRPLAELSLRRSSLKSRLVDLGQSGKRLGRHLRSLSAARRDS